MAIIPFGASQIAYCSRWSNRKKTVNIVDYVVAHELCHLSRPDHSPAFWKLLRTVLPDYEARRERLRREGSRFWL